MSNLKKIGPFEAVTHDVIREDGYRVVLSGAYNAMGLIGSEMNGIAVLDEVNRCVVADMIGRENSGWYGDCGGPSAAQVKMFEHLASAPSEDFARRVNELGDIAGRLRTEVEVRTPNSGPSL